MQPTTHTQTVGAKLLQVGARLVVESHVDLSQSLHVVYVHAHHVAQSVGQEHGVSALTHRLVNVAPHQSQLLQPLCHQATDGEVHVLILHAGFGHLQHVVVTLLHDGVDFQLPLREMPADGHGARVIRAVVVELATGIAQRQPPGLQRGVAGRTVHDFAVLREDGGKRDATGQRARHAVDLSADVALGHAWTDEPLRRGVHGVSHLASPLYGLDFLRLLCGAHLHYRLDEAERGCFALPGGVYARQVHELYHGVVAVGRQKVYASLHRASQLLHGSRARHAHLGGQVGDRRRVAHPDDVFHVDVVAVEGLGVIVHVDDAHQPVAVLAEVVGERRVLAERRVAVGRVVGRRLVVAEKHDDAVADQPFQFGPAPNVCLFAKHMSSF